MGLNAHFASRQLEERIQEKEIGGELRPQEFQTPLQHMSGKYDRKCEEAHEACLINTIALEGDLQFKELMKHFESLCAANADELVATESELDASLRALSMRLSDEDQSSWQEKQMQLVHTEIAERTKQFEEQRVKAMEAAKPFFVEQLNCLHSKLKQEFHHETTETSAKLNAHIHRLTVESAECNTRIDEHHVWNVELVSSFERMNGVVKSLEASFENLSAKCAGKLASVLEEEWQWGHEVIEASTSSRMCSSCQALLFSS